MATPVYASNDGPSNRPTFNRPQTTYGGMNEWMRMHGRPIVPCTPVDNRPIIPNNVPLTMTDANWKELRPQNIGLPYRPGSSRCPLPENNRTDEYYRRYLQLADNVAYRYPNPGPARLRQGRIGGSWRHIKEVLAQGGTRVVFVDGLVRLYDHSLNRRPKSYNAVLATPMYNPNPRDVEAQQRRNDHRYLPEYSFPALEDTTSTARPQTSKYKGFYTLRN